MVAQSQDGGFWLTCFACGDEAAVEATFVGELDGLPQRLARGVCVGCLAGVLTVELPTPISQRATLHSIEVAWTFDLSMLDIERALGRCLHRSIEDPSG